MIIGIVAGLGAVVFYEALRFADYVFLQVIAGYKVPSPVGEGAGLGLGTFREAVGHPRSRLRWRAAWRRPRIRLRARRGRTRHRRRHRGGASQPERDPTRTVFVKIVASALTIGSGGSGGREGPTGQISAGFGSFLARFFDLSPSDARIVVASGIGSGIGSIFGAPLGGAVLATEIMYRDDFEVEALLPAFIASIVGYSVWGSIEGFGPLFGFVGNYRLSSAAQLGWFGVIGVLGGLFGLMYAKGFYAFVAFFGRLSIPRWVRPAIGGLVVGCVGLAIPEVLGTGYGWIQQSLGPQLLRIPLWIVLILPFARIATTGLSIGSGGSGGIFGPGMVIGAFVGGAFWRLMEPLVPSLGHDPAPYVIVGMMACFGSISRAPLAVMLMVAEMTGNDRHSWCPRWWRWGSRHSSSVAGTTPSTRSQPRNRAESPAHRILPSADSRHRARSGGDVAAAVRDSRDDGYRSGLRTTTGKRCSRRRRTT